jgi:type IV pilus assembly protein PilX
MKGPRYGRRSHQGGIVLVVSLLLLVVITLLGVSMFRNLGIQEVIAGNLREKNRALQSAISAQQYAEWWLTTGNNINNQQACQAVLLQATSGSGVGEVCTNILPTVLGGAQNVTTVPWKTGGQEIGVAVTLPTNGAPNLNTGNVYFQPPRFYISLLGAAPSGVQGTIYQIDAWSYGSDPNTVAVVESTYLVSTGITDLGAQ